MNNYSQFTVASKFLISQISFYWELNPKKVFENYLGTTAIVFVYWGTSLYWSNESGSYTKGPGTRSSLYPEAALHYTRRALTTFDATL